VLAPHLKILFVGINPSLYSAAVGHHFARPGNRFWPGLAGGTITPRLLIPQEDRELAGFGCGLTNLVKRATARADELSEDELRRGARNLAAKVRRRRVACVAFLGITAYRTALARHDARIGVQPQQMGDARVWVIPNPSGLNAHYQLRDFSELFRELKEFVDAL